jgi:hypothetical protein
MPRPLDGASGERMNLPEYYADFQKSMLSTREFWKLERGQVFAEPGNASWEAFEAGDWGEALRLLEQGRDDLIAYYRAHAERGTISRRVRIVSLPLSGYLQWELCHLRIRDEVGGQSRILRDIDVAALEDQGPLPEIYTMNDDVMYQAVYDQHGVLAYALRYTDSALVHRCHRFIARLYDRGEPIASFFAREVAHLPPPRPTEPAIPRDYLVRTGRPGPMRS